MKKTFNIIIGCTIMLLGCKNAKEITKNVPKDSTSKEWKLVFEDQFDSSGSFNNDKWSYCSRGNAAWAKYLTSAAEYAYQEGGSLILRMDNRMIPGDNVPYHSGGIETKGKFSFKYGKVEVRAKFKPGRGSWPAIWMMPENSVYGGWPRSGEIDIMEHVNNETKVHQTIHNASVTGSQGGSSATHSALYKIGDFNVYGIIWTPEAVKFYVNNDLQYTYAKPAGADSKSWPFDQPFYLILNQSGGAGWPGPVTDADLPFEMQVDWVKVFQEN